jgi:hypothetical protein
VWRPTTPGALARLVLFVVGIAGFVHQEVAGSQPALLPFYAVMVGLPAFVGLDDLLRRGGEKKGPE